MPTQPKVVFASFEPLPTQPDVIQVSIQPEVSIQPDQDRDHFEVEMVNSTPTEQQERYEMQLTNSGVMISYGSPPPPPSQKGTRH